MSTRERTITTPSSPSAGLAHELLAREIAGITEPAAVGAALQRVCSRVSDNLRRSVGDDGFNALLSRVLPPARVRHPVVVDFRRIGESGLNFEGIVECIQSHGLPAVSVALESIVADLIEILSGLIGADMAMNLLDNDGPARHGSNGRPTS